MALLGKAQALLGLPSKVSIPKLGLTFETGPHEEARRIAETYMRAMGLDYEPIEKFAKIDPDRAKRIAAAYDEMKHDPEHPAVRQAYQAMVDETRAQYDALKNLSGLKAEFIQPGMADPYEASPRLATEDITKNNHFWVYPTDMGYGQEGITKAMEAENPMLAMTGEKISGQPARVNDLFRVVHDYFGHAKEGVGFRAGGEENAWRSHGSMYSPDALPAVTTETRGQNSWLNFGPHGERNRNASSADTIFADQKIGLLPKWAWREGLKDSDLAAILALLGAGSMGGLFAKAQRRTEA